MPPFEGVYTPLLTFFDERGEVDLQSQQRHVANLVNAGVHGLVPMASMGEFTAMNRAERHQVVEAVIAEAGGRATVVVHAGAPSTRQAVRLAQDAEATGADAVMSITPFYLKPDADGLRHHYRAIHEAVEIPVIAYDLPAFTGVYFPPSLILELAQAGTIQAVKDSSSDLVRGVEILNHKPEAFSYLVGADSLFASAVSLGGQGGVIGSSNVFPGLAAKIYELVTQDHFREAFALQRDLALFTEASRIGTFPAAAKHLVEVVWGLPSSSRPPVRALTESEKREVVEIVRPLLS